MASKEIADYFLIKNLYHCTPSQLDKESSLTTSLHSAFMVMESEEAFIQAKRAEQRAKQKMR